MNVEKTHQRIMELVKESGKSVRQVEQEADIGNGTIGKIKSRKKGPSIVTIMAIADYFGKPIDYFVA